MILHNDAVDAILTRRSIRSYQAKQISEDALETILTVGQFAPSGMNQQSAKAIVVQSKERMQQLVQLAKAAEQVDHNPFYDAPTVILVFADATQLAPLEDGCNVLENMMLAAHSLGIGSCWLNQLPGLTNMPLIRELLSDLDVPVNHIVYGSVVMGYAAEEPKQAALRKNVVNIIR